MRLNPMRIISVSNNSEIIYLFCMYYYNDLAPGLVVNLLDYGTGGQGSIPGWVLILQCFYSSFLAFLC